MRNIPRNSRTFKDLNRLLRSMMAHFPRNSWHFHGCLTNCLGVSRIFITSCQFSLGISGIFMDLASNGVAGCAKFLGIHGTFKHLDRTLRSMVPHFPTNSWHSHGCLTCCLGISRIVMTSCQFSLGISGIFMDLASNGVAGCAKFLGIHGTFKDLDRTLRSMMPHFPTNSWQFHGCLTNFLGISRIFMTSCQFSLGISGIFMDLASNGLAGCAKFLGIHGTFKDLDRTLRSMMPHFPTNSWHFHGCLTNFLGVSRIFMTSCQFSLGIAGTFAELASKLARRWTFQDFHHVVSVFARYL